MRHTFLACAALAIAGALTGCTGGGASIPPPAGNPGPAAAERRDSGADRAAAAIAPAAATPTPTSTPKATPTPKPSATPTPKPSATPAVYPFTPGDTFTYDYALKKTLTSNGTTSITQSFSGVVTAVLSGLGSYNGVPAYQLRTTGATSTGNASLDHTDYVNLVTSGGHTQYQAYGYEYKDTIDEGNGVVEHDSMKLTYATPFINDVLPQTASASWAEPVAVQESVDDYYQTSTNSPNILSGTETRAADGSYTVSGMVYDVPTTRLLRSNGTGYVIAGPASGSTEWSFGLPAKQSGHEVIPATESYAGMSATNFVPDWYPGGNLPTSPLATAKSTDLGPIKAPSSCAKRAGTLATHLQSTSSALDPVAGTLTTDVLDTYIVAGVGTICSLDDVIEKVYDTENTGALTSTTQTTTSQVLVSEVLK